MKPNPKIGDKVCVRFAGGIEGQALGAVIENPVEGGDFKIVLTEDFMDQLGKTWRPPAARLHRRGDKLIVHARELVEVLS